MSVTEILEAMMLSCFSLGWYWSIFTMVLTRQPSGKSAAFVICTVVGYLLGLSARVIDWQMSDAFSYLILLYSWNLAVCVIDLGLLLKLSRQDVARGRRDAVVITFSKPPIGLTL
ncbi:MAG: hypothetical protein AAFP67_06635 [Pseudomonadota bacterium]